MLGGPLAVGLALVAGAVPAWAFEVSGEIGPDTPVPSENQHGLASDVATDGADFLVVWQDHLRLWGGREVVVATRVDADGDIVDPFVDLPGSDLDQVGGSVAFDGTSYLIAWGETDLDAPSPSPVLLRAARVSRTGSVLDPDGALIAWTSRGRARRWLRRTARKMG